MKQMNAVKFQSECGKMSLHCDADTALGMLHDFLMMAKGYVIDRMQEAHRQESEYAEQMKIKEIESEALPQEKCELPEESCCAQE